METIASYFLLTSRLGRSHLVIDLLVYNILKLEGDRVTVYPTALNARRPETLAAIINLTVLPSLQGNVGSQHASLSFATQTI